MIIVRPTAVSDTSTFTRASTGTYIDCFGNVKTAAVNVPRFTYSLGNLNQGATALLEPAATNLLKHSMEFDNAIWASVGIKSVSANSTMAPDESQTADILNSSEGMGIYQSAVCAANTAYTFSVFAEPMTGTQVRLLMVSSGGAGASVDTTFTLNPGWNNVSESITTGAGDNSIACLIVTDNGGNPVSLWGAQLELGSESTSFIYTTSTTASRAADVNSSFILSNLPEIPPALYSSGTTYAAGDQVYTGTIGGVLTIYQSSIAANVGNTPASSVAWTQIGFTFAVYDPAYSYAANDFVIIVGAGVHEVYQSVSGGNTGNYPPTNAVAVPPATAPIWVDYGTDNYWSLFDGTVTSQSSNLNDISVNLTLPGLTDSIVIMNCSAAYLRITQSDSVDGVVYDQTTSLTSTSGINDMYDYFFEPIVRAPDVSINDLLPYANSSVSISLLDAGQLVECGTVVPGLGRDFGPTQYTTYVGIQDYSLKTQDAFGNYTITERAFRKTAEFIVIVSMADTDLLQNTLAERRALATVYVGNADFGSLIIYGFAKDYQLEFTDYNESTLTLDLEGLT